MESGHERKHRAHRPSPLNHVAKKHVLNGHEPLKHKAQRVKPKLGYIDPLVKLITMQHELAQAAPSITYPNASQKVVYTEKVARRVLIGIQHLTHAGDDMI